MGSGPVAWSPNGRYRLSALAYEGVTVWDAGSGDEALTFSGQWGGVSTVAWSPDSRSIAFGGGLEKMVEVWEL